MSGTNLYAGGYFTTAGGVPANNIAKWNGSAWSALGSGYERRSVRALAVSGTNLYAGGYFTTAGGVPANYIAKWNGSAWSALGSGMNGAVSALAVSGTDLYAGGYFTTAGGVAANNIAKWNGSAWSALGSGLERSTSVALAVSGTNLYAGGGFTTAGGVPANYIAKWDGSAWSALGSGMSGEVPVRVCAGGERDRSLRRGRLHHGGRGSGQLHRQMGRQRLVGFGLGDEWRLRHLSQCDVYALATDGVGHLFVGGAFYFAGTNLSPFIAQANIFPPGGAVAERPRGGRCGHSGFPRPPRRHLCLAASHGRAVHAKPDDAADDQRAGARRLVLLHRHQPAWHNGVLPTAQAVTSSFIMLTSLRQFPAKRFRPSS